MPTWLLSLLVFIAFWLASPVAANTLEVQVNVDRNPIIVNESFNLIITANEDLPRWAFNSQALLRDFIVGTTAMETSRSIQQGVSKQTTRWSVRLTARRAGKYTIPAFTIEGVTTQPLQIEVIAATTSEDGEQRPFFIQAEVSNKSPYVQQQLTYKVELFLQANTPLDSGSITMPEAEHADVELITQNRESQEIINGQRYRVITQEYAVTPQRSGPLIIKGAVFNGIYRSANVGNFTGFTRPEQVTLRTTDLQLQVEAKPDNFPGAWLVSEQVTLEEEWDSERLVLPVGEPITRTIIVTAEGVRPEQLPEPKLSWPSELRVYPERPQQASSITNGMRIAQARHTVVLIPSQTGTVTLPEVSIPWFNSRTHSIEHAQLPARELSLINPPGGLQSPSAQPIENITTTVPDSIPTLATELSASNLNTSELSANPSRASERLLLIVSVLWVATTVWVIWLVQKLRKVQGNKQRVVTQERVPIKAREALNALKRACNSNNNKAAISALESWQQARSGGLGSPKDLRSDFSHDKELIAQLDTLERSLYSAEKAPWREGKALWTAIARLHSQTSQAATMSPLAKSLYPS